MNDVAETEPSAGVGPASNPMHARPLLLALAVIVLVDQLTKIWAVAVLSGRDIMIIEDRLGFTLTRNPGASFSMFRNGTVVLALLAVVVSAVMWWALRQTADRILVTGLVMVLGGALGNLVDRFARSPGVLRGHVVDFVKVWPIPVFNVADACITIGAVIIVVRSAFPGADAEPDAGQPSGTEPEAAS